MALGGNIDQSASDDVGSCRGRIPWHISGSKLKVTLKRFSIATVSCGYWSPDLQKSPQEESEPQPYPER